MMPTWQKIEEKFGAQVTKVDCGAKINSSLGGCKATPTIVARDGREHNGEATLRLAEDGRPVYESRGGSPDMWLDGGTIAALCDLPSADYRATLDAIEAVCSAACAEVS